MIIPECDARCSYCGDCCTYECDDCGVAITREMDREDGLCVDCRAAAAARPVEPPPEIDWTALATALARARGLG